MQWVLLARVLVLQICCSQFTLDRSLFQAYFATFFQYQRQYLLSTYLRLAGARIKTGARLAPDNFKH